MLPMPNARKCITFTKRGRTCHRYRALLNNIPFSFYFPTPPLPLFSRPESQLYANVLSFGSELNCSTPTQWRKCVKLVSLCLTCIKLVRHILKALLMEFITHPLCSTQQRTPWRDTLPRDLNCRLAVRMSIILLNCKAGLDSFKHCVYNCSHKRSEHVIL